MLGAMKRRIEELLSGRSGDDTAADRESAIRLATATLMAEVARADRVLDVRELSVLRELLQSHFALSDEETRMVVDDGLEEAEHAVSLQGFTRPLHEGMVEEKRDLMLEGGYIPGCDHAIPPDIPWDNFIYYRECLHDIA